MVIAISALTLANGQTGPSKGIYWKQPSGAPIKASPAPAGAKLVYNGGPIVEHPVFYNVHWGPNVQPYGDQLDNFTTQVASSPEWNSVLAQYTGGNGPYTHIDLGVFGGKLQITPSLTGTTIDDSAIQTELEA